MTASLNELAREVYGWEPMLSSKIQDLPLVRIVERMHKQEKRVRTLLSRAEKAPVMSSGRWTSIGRRVVAAPELYSCLLER
jgi:hypothetical protein